MFSHCFFICFVMPWGFMMLLGHATKFSKALQNQLNTMKQMSKKYVCGNICSNIVAISQAPIKLLLAEGIKQIKQIKLTKTLLSSKQALGIKRKKTEKNYLGIKREINHLRTKLKHLKPLQ